MEAVLVTHGELGFSLKKTLEGLIGPQEGFFVFSNSGLGITQMKENLKELVDKTNSKEGIFVFVDLFGGSCWQAAKFSSLGKPKVALFSGVSLPMLISFFSKRGNLNFQELFETVKQGGEKGAKSEYTNADSPL